MTMVLKGELYCNEARRIVVAQDDGKSIDLDDTLMRSEYLRREVRITISLKGESE